MSRVEHPHVSAADTRRGQLRIAAGVLSTMRGRDERAALAGSGEYDVTGLVADIQRPDHATRASRRIDLDDAHAVGEVVDHPHLRARARGDRYRLESDGNAGTMLQAVRARREDFKPVVWGIDGEQVLAAR